MMAQDIDFRKKTRKPAESPKPAVRESRSKKPVRDRKVGWLTFIFILALAAVLTGVYYWSLQPRESRVNNPVSTIEEVKPELVVKIYDGGAGATDTETAAKKLSDSGYTVDQLGKSQFEYDKTYVWFVTGYQQDAEAIGALLGGREIIYKESRISGSFIIQIQMGRK